MMSMTLCGVFSSISRGFWTVLLVAQYVAGELDDDHLHTQADAEGLQMHGYGYRGLRWSLPSMPRWPNPGQMTMPS